MNPRGLLESYKAELDASRLLHKYRKMALLVTLVTVLLALRLTLVGARPNGDLRLRQNCNLPSWPGVTCSNNIVTFNSPYGPVKGTLANGAIRVTLKYATAARFQPPQIVPPLSNSSGSANLPPMCPQADVSPSSYSEDCLYFVAYVPTSVNPATWSWGVPVLVWIHGGSYNTGSASDPIFDGSKLAQSTGSIVVVVQYRLGILGYLPPQSLSNNKNLGVRDVITSLQYIQNIIGCIGGDKNKVTLVGHSSGGNMIRNLLATPSADNLFSKAIIESDPINYGFLQPSTFTALQSAFYGNLTSCGTCLTTPVSTLLTAQSTLINNAPGIDPAAGMSQPIRPVLDGTLIKYSLTTTFPPTLKNILLTTVKDEAGSAIYSIVNYPLPPAYFMYAATGLFGATRATQIDDQYKVSNENVDDIRPELVVVSTDGAWRCPTYTLARTWAQRGGNVWVGQFTIGATIPYNSGISFCTTNGNVCHQDELEIVFGTVPSPTPAQAALTAEVQARWGAFVKTGNPNTSGYANWPQIPRGGAVPVYNLGGTTSIPLGACDPSVWGSSILYDYQIYGQ